MVLMVLRNKSEWKIFGLNDFNADLILTKYILQNISDLPYTINLRKKICDK